MTSRISDHSLFKLSKNNLEFILKKHNLTISDLNECVALLRVWINKQSHFIKKDFSQNFLEMTIISCKGSVERAKLCLEQYCTLRTAMPRFFDKANARRDFKDMHAAIKLAILPQCTADSYRVFIAKHTSRDVTTTTAHDFYRYGTLCLDYLKAHDHFDGAVLVVDYMDVSVTDVIPALNPVDLADIIKLCINGYKLRVKGIYFLTSSRLIETVVSLLKSLVSSKIGSRIHVHTNLETLHDSLPKDILPVEYGGNEKSFYDIHEDCVNMLSKADTVAYLMEMKNAGTNESHRTAEALNNGYLGTPGTFRSLAVD